MRAVMAPHWARPSRRIVGDALHHEQRAQVGVAEAERAEVVRLLGDRHARELGHVDGDFEDQRPEPLAWRKDSTSKRPRVGIVELEQVQRREIAGGIVEEHVFASTDSTH